MTVGEMRRRMGELEYRQWIAFYRFEAEQRRIEANKAKAERAAMRGR